MLLWVGINDTARIVIIVLSAVPAILVVVMEGVKTVDNSLIKAAHCFGAGHTNSSAPWCCLRRCRSWPPESEWVCPAA